MSKNTTQAEKNHMARVAELPCVACNACPVHVHHIREGQGTSEKASPFLTIPLCPEHHQGAFSIHNARREFMNIYGSELKLLAKTIGMLEL